MKTVLDYLKIKNMNDINDFIISIKNNEVLPTEYHLNPYFVLDKINNEKTRMLVIERLLDLDYDFKKPFPVENFTDIESVGLSINNLKKEYDYFMFYINKGEIINTKDGLKLLICRANKKLTPFVFRVGFDIFLNKNNKNEVVISLNPKNKKHYSLLNVYKKLNKLEPGVWSIWDGNLVVKTFKGSSSKLDIDTIKEYLINFNLN